MSGSKKIELLNYNIKFNYNDIVGQSLKMRKVFSLLKKIAPTSTRILIQGESGTGKEMIARAIHLNSHRKDHNFVAVDCGAIPENLLESELFGYVKGAFTGADRDKKGLFEEANGGTLFLDEIGNMGIHIQGKLLRAIQEKEIRLLGTTSTRKIDVRIISASRLDLKKLVKEHKFREDLYYRINVVSIRLPALREREGDICLLTECFIKRFSKEMNKPIKGIQADALQLLESYDWPGNVRELENVIERAVALSEFDNELITLPLISEPLIADVTLHHSVDEVTNSRQETLAETLERIKREMVFDALIKFRGNKSKTAASLGVSRCGLNKMLKKWKSDE